MTNASNDIIRSYELMVGSGYVMIGPVKIGITASPADPQLVDYVVEAERLGVESVWVPEFWGYDAFTPLAALAIATDRVRLGTAIAQIGTRTPAMLAMTAASLQRLAGGRFVLGIGASGPQVIEGWHGVDFQRPVQRTRETIEIVRLALSGQRLAYDGQIHRIPRPGPDGQGKPLRLAAEPTDVPIHVASLGPANLRLTGELADGWIGNSFLCSSSHVFLDHIRSGAAAAGRALDDVELSLSVGLEITDDVEEAGRRHAAGYAFTIGAMGSSDDNFYNNAFGRQGMADDIAEVRRLWQEGEREAAGRRVPIELGLGTNLVGPVDEIKRRIDEYRACGISLLRVHVAGPDDVELTIEHRLNALAQLLELVK